MPLNPKSSAQPSPLRIATFDTAEFIRDIRIMLHKTNGYLILKNAKCFAYIASLSLV